MRAERAGDDLDLILSGACTCGSIRTLWKNNSFYKSFVSGVLAGHDNRVSCLGVTEVNVYIGGHPRKRMLHRLHLNPNRMEEQLQLEVGTGGL